MTTDPPLITARRIIAWIASRYGVTEADLMSSRRKFNVNVWPRWMAMWLIRKNTALSHKEIRDVFTICNHTTVGYAIKAVERYMLIPERRQEVEELERAWAGQNLTPTPNHINIPTCESKP